MNVKIIQLSKAAKTKPKQIKGSDTFEFVDRFRGTGKGWKISFDIMNNLDINVLENYLLIFHRGKDHLVNCISKDV